MADTSIEWTHREGTVGVTWNPTTGCDRISAGCDNCYALTLAKRLKAMGSAKYQTDGDPRTSGPGFGVAVHADALRLPLTWRKPRTVFVNSMSDLFHARVPAEFVARVFAVMAATPQHTYQILTKRPERMARVVGSVIPGRPPLTEQDAITAQAIAAAPWPLPNVWLGTSVEDQATADRRIPALLDTPAAVRFLSMEPLLGPVDLEQSNWAPPSRQGFAGVHNPLTGEWWPAVGNPAEEYRDRLTDLPRIDWVIAGGESGPGARPMSPAWVRDLRDQCQESGTAFFFKQWGDHVPPSQMPEGTFMDWDIAHGTGAWDRDEPWRMGKKRAGRLLDERTWDEFPAERVAVGA
ncbi:DUF5131 family protein [Micromonospora carbonacea]|uniref:Protein gp37 n=1 Tax=Micromonospora carbonacea TaxID=47853 RepID=A0A1C5ACM7_9ACTN|nr:phage Gp37/Gp68 family protein [Micromonospora carbonacea]SCF43002.1 protein gp37 [Micromonospora carbonacea]